MSEATAADPGDKPPRSTTATVADSAARAGNNPPPMSSALRAIDVSAFVRNRAVGRGLRVALVLPLVLGGFMWAGYPRAGFLASFAVITTLLTSDFSGPRRERFTSIMVVVAAGEVTLILGVLLQSQIWLQVVAALVLGIVVTLLSVARGFLSKAVVPVLLPFFIAATSSPGATGQMLLGWLIGGLIAGVAAITLWPFFPRRVVTEAISEAMEAEAAAIDSFWNATSLGPSEARDGVDAAVKQVHNLFVGNLNRPGSAYRRERSLVRLIEEVRRMRLGLRLAYRRLPFHSSAADEHLARVTAEALTNSAIILREQRNDLSPFEAIETARITHYDATVSEVGQLLGAGASAAAQQTGSSSFRPRSISLLAMSMARDAGAGAGRGELPPLEFRGENLPAVVQAARPSTQIRAELSWRAPWMRNALRLGVALALALVVVDLMGLQRGYWVVLGTLGVLRLDVSGTGRAAWSVIFGQFVGFGLGLAIIAATSGRPALAWALLPIIAGVQGYLAGNGPAWMQQAGFTALVIALVSVVAPRGDIPLIRLEDVTIGVAVAIVVSLLIYPRGLVPLVEESLTEAITASNAYFQRALLALDGETPAEDDVPPTLQLTRAAETIDLAVVQGTSQHTALNWWLRIWAACEYLVYVAGILHVVARTPMTAPPARRATAAVSVAGRRAGDRFEKYNLELLGRCESLPAAAASDESLGVIEYSADVDHALAMIDRTVASMADARDASAADWAVRTYWRLGWVGEIDLLAANTRALLAAARLSR